jgi:hypothetical protein
VNPTWDINTKGPLDRCIRCFTQFPNPLYLGYCLECGYWIRYGLWDSASGDTCFYHNDKPATTLCTLCGNVICKECDDGNSYCSTCRDKSKNIEIKFIKYIKDNNCCSKHYDSLFEFNCNKCGINICSKCAYFYMSRKHFFSFKYVISEGPFCLLCMRKQGKYDANKISGHDAMIQGILNRRG